MCHHHVHKPFPMHAPGMHPVYYHSFGVYPEPHVPHYQVPYYSFPYCPVCYQPSHLCCCPQRYRIILPQEVLVDASDPAYAPKNFFIGGMADIHLTLEYMPAAGASSTALVRVTITGSNGTSTWEETPIPDEYNVKDDFSDVAPGSRITLEVTDAVARLRWCEVVEY